MPESLRRSRSAAVPSGRARPGPLRRWRITSTRPVRCSEVARLCSVLAHVIVWEGRPEEAVAVAIRGLEALDPEASVRRGHALCDVIFYQAFTASQQAEAERRLAEAEATLLELDDPDLNARVRYARFFIALTTYRLALALDAAEQLCSGDARPRLPPRDDLDLFLHLSRSLQWAGHWSQAGLARSEARRLCEKFNNTVGRAVLGDLEQFELRATSGDFELDGERAISDAEIESDSFGGWLGARVWYRGLERLWQGRWEAGLEDFRRPFRFPLHNTYYDGLAASFEMLALGLLDERDELSRLVEEHRRSLPRVGELNPTGSWELAFSVTEACAHIGREEEAAALYPTLEQARRQGIIVRDGAHRLVETLLGIASACAGDDETSDDHFATALLQAQELPLLTERAEARRWWAWALLRRGGAGERERARALLGEALTLYEEMGLTRHGEQAASMLPSSSEAPPPTGSRRSELEPSDGACECRRLRWS